jgi:DNA-binding MarR family transcriptional regulator
MAMKKMTQTNEASAERAWTLMFDLLMSSGQARAESLLRRGLTPNDARALWSLDLKDGRPIGELARDWGCDPSNATFIVDRLEKAGLAERHASTADRRVKLVLLTKAGAATKSELQLEYRRPPPEILALDQTDLEALAEILGRIALKKDIAGGENNGR